MKKIKSKVSKIILTLILSFIVISLSKNIYAKYIFQEEFCIANLNIDRTKPKIEILSVENTNTQYPKYANIEDTITMKIKITEKNQKEKLLDKNHIKAEINNKNCESTVISCTSIEKKGIEETYKIQINKLDGNGKLKLKIVEGAVTDEGDLKNQETSIDTGITIDNIKPTGKLEETKISDGKVNATITLSEQIKNIDGWGKTQNGLKINKEFTNNVSYELPIEDFAGNKSKINIDITKATYINIVYASHNSRVGWTYGYGNYDVAGSEAIKQNSEYKTEALAFKITGNIEKDFVQANAYVHTYWGEGGQARCTTSKLIYNHGYNPGKDMYKSMASNDLVSIEGNKYFQLGGAGVNGEYQTDINGKNPIPDTKKFYYGISGIKMKLKNYNQFSIVYQILVNDVGWTRVCSNGQECMYNKTKPMSAFRIALIPNSEKQHIIDTWNKDVGTYNLKK